MTDNLGIAHGKETHPLGADCRTCKQVEREFKKVFRNVWHVYPNDDLGEHKIEGLGCTCNPKIEFVDKGWIVTHRAFDDRKTEDGSTKKEIV